MAKAGISFGGEFKSQYFSSGISGPGADSTLRLTEGNEFTSVDFDIKARPNEAVTGRLIFRMHQNWQNFFSDISNPIFSRWISIDGKPLDMFRFNVGDFKEKYSPLTLFTPEIEMLYEPYIFARQRQLAMDELFLGDNYRVLQGVNLGFDAEIAPLFNEFHFGLIGSRLTNTEVHIQNGSSVTAAFQVDPVMAKYFVGSNLDITMLKGISFGATWLSIFDHKGSYEGKATDTVSADTLAQKTTVISIRPAIDIGKTAGLTEALQLKLGAEFAFSVDGHTSFDSVRADTANKAIREFKDSSIIGSAIKIGGDFGFFPSKAFNVLFNGSIISNDTAYRNILAQTPSFLGRRIMNVNKKDNNTTINTSASHYTTFDALYHSVFKFTPENSWSKAPTMKTSYYKGILHANEIDGFLAGSYDPSVQLIMPLGPATPNRVGIDVDLKVGLLNNGLEVSALMTMLNEKIAEVKDAPKTAFSQIGAGLKFDLGKIVETLKIPVELSGSAVLSDATNAGDDDNLKWAISSDFINMGLRLGFCSKGSLIAGMQLINNVATYDTTAGNPFKVEQKQTHLSAGLEWKVSDGASIVGTIGKIIADTDDNQNDPSDAVVVNEWPDEYGLSAGSRDFSQMLIDISLRVKF
jgi:hypothetical protein